MSTRSLAARVAALEAKVGAKTLEEQFLEEAELIDRRFGEVNQQLLVMRTDLGTVRKDVEALKKDMGIVREGMSILLKRQ